MRYTDDQLTEAKRQIDSTLHKLRETLKTLEGKETLAVKCQDVVYIRMMTNREASRML